MRNFVNLFYVTFYPSNFCTALTALSMLGYVGQQKIKHLTELWTTISATSVYTRQKIIFPSTE